MTHLEEIKLPLMPDDVAILLTYATAKEKVEVEYGKYIALPDRRLYRFMDSGALAGCVGVVFRNGQEVEIRHLAVAAEKRRRGIGKAMIQAVLKELTPNVIVAETDREAVGFYRNAGFNVTSIGEKYPNTERFVCRYEQPE